MVATGFFLFLLPFIELMPAFTCNPVGSTETYSCTEKDFCGVEGVEFILDWSKEFSLNNWYL